MTARTLGGQWLEAKPDGIVCERLFNDMVGSYARPGVISAVDSLLR